MAREFSLAFGLIVLVVSGCTSSPRLRLLDVSEGMSSVQVSDILGEPARQSVHEPYSAWIYEYAQIDSTRCTDSTPNAIGRCEKKCTHAIVWFNQDVVKIVTGYETENVTYCGEGLVPIDWDKIPEAVRHPRTGHASNHQ